jgi:HPt (histidine-containing phosphotransfer) domain-containing protein
MSHSTSAPTESENLSEKSFFKSSSIDVAGRPYCKIKGLDVDGALIRVANRWDFYNRLVSRFYAEHLDFFDRYRVENEQNKQTAHRMLHSLKGISGTIGATDLYPVAVEAEQAYKDNNPNCEVLVLKAERSLNKLLKNIAKSQCFDIVNTTK